MISSKKFFAEYKNSEKLNIMRIKSGRADNMIRLATELPKAAGNSDIYMSMNPLTRVNHSVRRDPNPKQIAAPVESAAPAAAAEPSEPETPKAE